jgi:hypothetical protein
MFSKSALFVLVAFFVLLAQAIPIVKRAYSIQIKSGTDFCTFLPPHAGDDVGATEDQGKPFCTSSALGGQTFPSGFIKSAHYVSTSKYVQVTGKIDRTKYQLSASDGGGQYDNKDVSATCNGYKYFVNMLEPDSNRYCIRCCSSQSDCNLGKSTYGCPSIVPGNYN